MHEQAARRRAPGPPSAAARVSSRSRCRRACASGLSFLTGFVLDGLPGWRETIAPARRRSACARSPIPRCAPGSTSRRTRPRPACSRTSPRWERLEIVEGFTPETKRARGPPRRRHREASSGKAPFDVLLDIVVADELRTGLRPDFGGPEPDEMWKMRADVWRDPRAMIGGSDAGAHLDMMCGASYSTFVVGDAVRNGYVVARRSRAPAERRARAALRRARPRPPRARARTPTSCASTPPPSVPPASAPSDDLPGGASRIVAESQRRRSTCSSNGTEIVRDGAYTGATPGTVLRAGRDTDNRPRSSPRRPDAASTHSRVERPAAPGRRARADGPVLASGAPTIRMPVYHEVQETVSGRRGRRHVRRPQRVRSRATKTCCGRCKHPEVFSSKDVVNIGNDVPLIPLSVDPPDHAKYRRLLDPQFSPKKMAALEPEVARARERDHRRVRRPRRVRVPRRVRDAAAVDDLPRARWACRRSDLPQFLQWRDDTIRPEGDRRRGGDQRSARRRARRSTTTSRPRSRRSAATPTTGCSAASCTARSTAGR